MCTFKLGSNKKIRAWFITNRKVPFNAPIVAFVILGYNRYMGINIKLGG